MDFSLNADGAQSAVGGLSKLFQSAALAPYMRDQAQSKAALTNATTYAHNMAGNRSGALATTEGFNLDQRKGVDDLVNDPALAPYYKNMLRLFKMTGDKNALSLAKSGSEFQNQGIKDEAMAAVPNADPTLMNKLISVGADKAYLPNDNVGNTGYTLNKATGTQTLANKVLGKLFGDKEISATNENNAQAGNASASADEHRAKTQKVISEIDGTGPGKPLSNSQKRTNTQIDSARDFIATVPRDVVTKVLNKSDFDMTPGDKDLLARVKMARSNKFGEAQVPNELNNMLGLDPAAVDSLASQLGNPPIVKGVIDRLFNRPGSPKSEADIASDFKSKLPAADASNIENYLSTARMKTGSKNPAPAPAASNIPSGNSMLDQARAAIAKGAPRQAVEARLREKGIDPGKL